MATITPLDSKTSTANTTSYASNAFVPAAGDLLHVFVVATGTVDAAPTMTDSQSLGMTRIAVTATWATSTHTIYEFVSNAQAAASSMTVTFDCTADAATGCAIFVAGVQGMPRVGSNAVRQFKALSNQTSGTTPAPDFAAAALTGNPTLGVVGNSTNPAAVTEPSGWTERADVGYASPTTGAEYVSRDSGFTGTTITWGSTSPSGFAVLTVELDASSPTVDLVIQNTSHAHSAANLVLTQVHALVVANASHSQTAANLVLTQVHVLDVQSADHAHTADSLTLEVVYDLVIDSSAHSHTAESIELAQVHVLSIANGLHSHTAESLTLTQVHELVIASATHSHTAESPLVRPTEIVFLDPGGDAVQAVGYFNNDINTTGLISFDSTQKVVGVGSYKFDSDDGTFEVTASVAGVFGLARRVSTYFRYDSVPDAIITATEFDAAPAVYSGGGFNDLANFTADDGFYATATPAQNAGQGTAFSSFGLLIGVGKVIDSVKIIYERKYDVNTSEGISRVKYRIDGVEGPDHDNTDEPLTDTVVTVDVTADRAWTWQDLQDGVFEVIVEARRGDTATAHTQSWDYVKVEVQYHLPTAIFSALNNGLTITGFQIAIVPKGAGCVLRFVDGAGESYDGITQLDVDTWSRISFGFIQHGADDLDIKLYVNGIEELSIVGAATGGTAAAVHLHYGWIFSPGASHLCWFDQLYIDDGDDLSDCGNKLSTHKGPGSTNENNWNTTIGTGAVDERPLSITNGKQHTSVTGVRQTYTLQATSVGDIDLTGKTLVGYMGWAWAKVGAGDLGDALAFIVSNVEQSATSLGTTAMLLKRPVTSSAYPSDAAGIGMRSNDESADTFLYECGVIVAYEGPVVPSALLDFQILAEDSTTGASDDMGSDPPASYELRSQTTDNVDAVVTTTIYSADEQGGSPQQQVIIESHGGDDTGLTTFNPGEEVTTSTHVTGEDADVDLRRSPNNE